MFSQPMNAALSGTDVASFAPELAVWWVTPRPGQATARAVPDWFPCYSTYRHLGSVESAASPFFKTSSGLSVLSQQPLLRPHLLPPVFAPGSSFSKRHAFALTLPSLARSPIALLILPSLVFQRPHLVLREPNPISTTSRISGTSSQHALSLAHMTQTPRQILSRKVQIRDSAERPWPQLADYSPWFPSSTDRETSASSTRNALNDTWRPQPPFLLLVFGSVCACALFELSFSR